MKFKNYGSHYITEDSHGQAFINHDVKLIYFNIPKCASSSVKQVFVSYDLNFNRELSYNFGSYKKFAVIREPVDRTISTLTFYLSGRRIQDYGIDKMMFLSGKKTLAQQIYEYIKELKQVVGIDPHCQLQIWSITDKNFKPIKIDYLIPQPYVFNCLNVILGQYFPAIKIPEYRINVSHQGLKNAVSSVIRGSSELLDDIYEIYQPDFELYEMAMNSRKEILA